MFLKVLGSSSGGNCYLLDSGKETLIIEAGIDFKLVKRALDFNLRKVVGCLVSHRHNDHARYVEQIVGSGIYTLAPEDVWQCRHEIGRLYLCAETGKGYKFGDFRVVSFAACHDVPCVGYHISHPDCGNVLFLTDSFMCEYRFENLNHILIECNYSDKALANAIAEGRTLPYQRKRLMTTHMELATTRDFVVENNSSALQEVVLLHLSDDNSDAAEAVDAVQRVCGKPVYVADKGLEIELTKA